MLLELLQVEMFNEICEDIMRLPDENDRSTLHRLVGDAKVAIELCHGDDILNEKDKLILWNHICNSATNQPQWNKQIPAEFFILEREILYKCKGSHFVYIHQINEIIHENRLDIDENDLKDFLT